MIQTKKNSNSPFWIGACLILGCLSAFTDCYRSFGLFPRRSRLEIQKDLWMSVDSESRLNNAAGSDADYVYRLLHHKADIYCLWIQATRVRISAYCTTVTRVQARNLLYTA